MQNLSADPRYERAKALHAYLHPLAKNNAFKTPVTEIEPGLFLGGKPTPNFPEVDAVLSVADKVIGEPQISYKDDNSTADALLWMPIHDRPPFPGVDWLDIAVSYIEKVREHDWKILVHCEAGMSRSAMVMVAYFMKRDKMSVDDALNYVLRKRAIAPRPEFLVGLQDYEQFLQGSTNEGATSGSPGV